MIQSVTSFVWEIARLLLIVIVMAEVATDVVLATRAAFGDASRNELRIRLFWVSAWAYLGWRTWMA